LLHIGGALYFNRDPAESNETHQANQQRLVNTVAFFGWLSLHLVALRTGSVVE